MKESRAERIWIIFREFLKFGCFTFGGGWSIVAQIRKEFVEKRRWITDEELLDFTSVGRSTPGLMIGNAAILFVARAMIGVRAAVVPIIFSALLKLFKSGMKDGFCYLVAVAAFCLCLFTPLNNVLIVLLGAAAGLLYQEVKNRDAVS